MHKIEFVAISRWSKLSEIGTMHAVTDDMLQTSAQTLNHVVATSASEQLQTAELFSKWMFFFPVDKRGKTFSINGFYIQYENLMW